LDYPQCVGKKPLIWKILSSGERYNSARFSMQRQISFSSFLFWPSILSILSIDV